VVARREGEDGRDGVKAEEAGHGSVGQ
jgi:hypothetical protein